VNVAEFERRMDEAGQDEVRLDAVLRWLMDDQRLPAGTARLMVSVEEAKRRGDDLEDVFP
jgi:hypothetical protein